MHQSTSLYRVDEDLAQREGPAIVLWLGLALTVVGLVDAFLVVPLTDGVPTGISAYLILVALGWVFFSLCALALAWYLVSGTRLLNRPRADGVLGAGRYLAKVGVGSLMCSWISLSYILPGTLARQPLNDGSADYQATSLPFDLGGFLVQMAFPALLVGTLALFTATVCFSLVRIKAS